MLICADKRMKKQLFSGHIWNHVGPLKFDHCDLCRPWSSGSTHRAKGGEEPMTGNLGGRRQCREIKEGGAKGREEPITGRLSADEAPSRRFL